MLHGIAALRAARLEIRGHDARRHARLALIAMGPVGERAAAAKPGAHQFAIDSGIDHMTGCRDLRARQPLRQITARVRRSRVKLQNRQRELS